MVFFCPVHILLAGYGFLGSAIARLLQDQGHTLTVIRRSAADPNGTEFVEANLSDAPPWNTVRSFDAAIFCLAPDRRDGSTYAATYCKAQQNLAAVCRASQYIYISSTAVYAEAAGEYAEGDAAIHSERAAVLLEAETIALQQQDAAVLRLAGLYNSERRIYYAAPDTPSADRLMHFIHRDDAARAVLHTLQKRLTGIYNVHDGNPLWRSQIFTGLGFAADQLSVTAPRHILCEKFLATGFLPLYKNFIVGLQH